MAAKKMVAIYIGRPKANTFEPTFTSLLHTLIHTWNNETFAKNTEPVLAAIELERYELATKGTLYEY
jgi:hypothetical protein